MTLQRLAADELDRAAAMLAGGQVIAVPTDTVYGLAASLDVPAAVRSLFDVKGRPSNVPVAVLCATAEQAVALATSWPDAARALTARFWPGALTLVVACDEDHAALLGAKGGVGLRVPADEVCAALLARTGPLAVTSANLHGTTPCTRADEVLGAFEGTVVAGVLDAGVRDGAVSTVVDVRAGLPAVLREGAISPSEVSEVVRAG